MRVSYYINYAGFRMKLREFLLYGPLIVYYTD